MSVVELQYKHVVVDDAGTPVIAETSMKVMELVLEQVAYGWSPEELHFQHPYLSLGQIHSALAYYWDHQEELDRDIERRLATVEDLRSRLQSTSLVARLRMARKL